MEKQLKTKWLIGALITFLCCAFYAALISFRTMPISEGWYTEYAWQINHGNLPYRDFEYLFFPLYMYIIAGFTQIFGYSIIALRILGVFIFGGIGVALYFLFSKLFDNLSGIVAAVIAALYLQSEVAQVFYDYIRFHDLFAIIAATLLVYFSYHFFAGSSLKYEKKTELTSKIFQIIAPGLLFLNGIVGLVQSLQTTHRIRIIVFLFFILLSIFLFALSVLIGKKRKGKYYFFRMPIQSILCGIFVSAECMIKQSNGTLMIAFILVYLLFCAVIWKSSHFFNGLIGTLTGILFSFSLLLTYLLFTNSFDAFITCCFKNAIAAKGGFTTVLLHWIPSAWSSFWTNRVVAFILIILIDLLIGFCAHRKLEGIGRRYLSISVLALSFCGAVLAFVCWVFVYRKNVASMAYNQYDTNIPAVVFFVCAAAFACIGIYLLFCAIQKKAIDKEVQKYIPLFPVLGAVFAQGYGSGMSGGLTSSQTVMGFGLLLAFILHMALSAKRSVIAVGVAVFSLFLGATFTAKKTVQTYDWWSLTQGSIWEHTEEVNVPLLQGIKVRDMDKIFFESVYTDITENTDIGDSIFVFPQCPIIYTITGRHSITYSKVQWFDVSSEHSIESDIDTLWDTPPKIIVYINLPDSVYEGHESGFHTFQTRKMRDFLLNTLIPEYHYEIINSNDLGNGYTSTTYLLED